MSFMPISTVRGGNRVFLNSDLANGIYDLSENFAEEVRRKSQLLPSLVKGFNGNTSTPFYAVDMELECDKTFINEFLISGNSQKVTHLIDRLATIHAAMIDKAARQYYEFNTERGGIVFGPSDVIQAHHVRVAYLYLKVAKVVRSLSPNHLLK